MLTVLPAACIALGLLATQDGPDPALARLGRQMTYEAVRMFAMNEDQLLPEDIDLALQLAEQGARFQPDDADAWRVLLQGADAAEDHDRALMAIERLNVLDPADEMLVLRRLLATIDQLPTVEERVAAFESMLAPDRRAKLSRPLAARLALALSVLLDRSGDRDGMLEWLKESLALDPFYSAAADLALVELGPGAPTERVTELLIARSMANPANLEWLEQLSVYALARGAYVAATRILDLVVVGYGGIRSAPPTLAVDRALAAWGMGRTEECVSLLVARSRAAEAEVQLIDEEVEYYDTVVRPQAPSEEIQKKGDKERAARIARRRDVVRSLVDLASIRVLILQGANRPEALTQGVSELATWSEALAVAIGEAAPNDAPAAAAPRRDAAEIILFANGDLDLAEGLLTGSLALTPLPDAQAARLTGWRALREGRYSDAEAAFAPLVPDDRSASVGLALVRIANGDQRGAATLLLDVARAEPGRARSIWAYDRLATVLGTRAPLSNDAATIDRLVAAVPDAFDRLVSQPGRAVTLRLSPVQDSIGPADPILLNVQLTNSSGLPLALSPGGPISPEIAVPFTLTSVAAQRVLQNFTPPLLSFGGPIRMEPRTQTTARINLSRGVLENGALVNDLVSSLSLVDSVQILYIRAILNPAFAAIASRPGWMQPGMLGVESIPFYMNVVGLNTDETMGALLQALRQEPTDSDVVKAGVLLQQYLGWLEAKARIAIEKGLTTDPAQLAELDRSLGAINTQFPAETINSFSDALQLAFLGLTPAQRAWLVLSLPPAITLASSAGLAPLSWIVDAARNSTEPVVQVAALIRFTGLPPQNERIRWELPSQDPFVEQCAVSPDPLVRQVALLRQAIFRARDDQAVIQARGGAVPASP
ncbi:MAG: hypothetical protein KDA22_10630 [Phycisphaerales bacterium]|nr:hypothetical protein [Phycisphaerales bacterium]